MILWISCRPSISLKYEFFTYCRLNQSNKPIRPLFVQAKMTRDPLTMKKRNKGVCIGSI